MLELYPHILTVELLYNFEISAETELYIKQYLIKYFSKDITIITLSQRLDSKSCITNG